MHKYKHIELKKSGAVMSHIRSAKFLSEWGNGRPLKHGAMRIEFEQPHTRYAVTELVEKFMYIQGEYIRGEHYHIPGWNFGHATEFVSSILVTFVDSDTFITVKMCWEDGQ
jgi:hypothetical protein